MVTLSTRRRRKGVTAIAVVAIGLVFSCAVLLASLVSVNRALVVGFGPFDVGLGSTTATQVHFVGMPPVTESSSAKMGANYCAETDPYNLALGPVGVGFVGCKRWERLVPTGPLPGATRPAVQPTP